MRTIVDLAGPSPAEAPADPLMTFEEAARLLHLTVAGLRKELERGSELGQELLPFVVKLSERRRYFKRAAFMDWLRSKSQ